MNPSGSDFGQYKRTLILSDAAPMYAGKPGRFKKRPLSSSGSHSGYMEDWHKVVKNLVVSSKEAQASRLVDGTGGYWQSSGAQGKVSTFTCIYKGWLRLTNIVQDLLNIRKYQGVKNHSS